MSSKHVLWYHLVLVTKYRITLSDRFWVKCKESIINIKGVDIKEINQHKDHIHILLTSTPSEKLSDIVKKIKQISTHKMYSSYSVYLREHYWHKERMSRSKGYYIASVGASLPQVVSYIRNQNA